MILFLHPLKCIIVFRSLRQLFINEVLKHKEPGLDKVHRNDIAALLIKLMLRFPNIKFYVAGISEGNGIKTFSLLCWFIQYKCTLYKCAI